MIYANDIELNKWYYCKRDDYYIKVIKIIEKDEYLIECYAIVNITEGPTKIMPWEKYEKCNPVESAYRERLFKHDKAKRL